MKQKRSWVNIYHDGKGGNFLIFAMGGGASGRSLLDPPEEIARNEFDTRIGAALVEALDAYQERASNHQIWRASEGARKFISKHLCVSIERMEAGDLDVVPLHHEGSGYIGKQGQHIIVPAAEINGRIAAVLKEAFAVAS